MPAAWVENVAAFLRGAGGGLREKKQWQEEKRKTRAAEELAERQVAVSEKAEARQERMTVAEISALTANTIFRKEELGLQTRDQLFREGMGAAENLFRYYGFTWDREKFYKGLELDLYKYENVSGGEKAQIDLQTLIHRTASAGAKLQSKTQKELVGLQGMETRETARLGAALGIGSELELFGAQEEILRGLLPEGAYEKIVAGGKGPALLPGGRTWQRAIPPSDVTTEAARAQSYGGALGQITGQVAGYKEAGIPMGMGAARGGGGGGGGYRRTGRGGGGVGAGVQGTSPLTPSQGAYAEQGLGAAFSPETLATARIFAGSKGFRPGTVEFFNQTYKEAVEIDRGMMIGAKRRLTAKAGPPGGSQKSTPAEIAAYERSLRAAKARRGGALPPGITPRSLGVAGPL